MESKLNVRALKGAPLSIVIVLMLEKRSVSHALLCQETGYSDRTVTQGLDFLVRNQIVTRCGHSGFMLTGENYQLPLYWDEQTTPADPSPALTAPEIVIPEAAPENFSGRNFEFENRKIYDLENQVKALEERITALENRKNYDSKAEIIVNSTTESTLINNQTVNTDTNDKEGSLIDSGELREICEVYDRASLHGIEYSEEEYQELVDLHPDPEILEFVLPRAGSFEAAKKWCSRDRRHVKYHLLKKFGVTMPALQRITDNEEISPWLIDHHYWEWFQEHDPAHTLGWAVRKIENQYDRMNAENSDPLQYAYL